MPKNSRFGPDLVKQVSNTIPIAEARKPKEIIELSITNPEYPNLILNIRLFWDKYYHKLNGLKIMVDYGEEKIEVVRTKCVNHIEAFIKELMDNFEYDIAEWKALGWEEVGFEVERIKDDLFRVWLVLSEDQDPEELKVDNPFVLTDDTSSGVNQLDEAV